MKVHDFLDGLPKQYQYLTAVFMMLGMKIALVVNLLYSLACMLFAFHWLHVAVFVFTILLIILLRLAAKYALNKVFKIEVDFNDSSNL